MFEIAKRFPEEAFLDTLPARRRYPSGAARQLARQAIVRLGGVEQGIGRSPDGAPEWPAGWTGSLSHDQSCATALVSESGSYRALGVDIEPAEPLPEDAASLVLSAAERRRIEQAPGGYERWSRVVFGAKECVHKCLHPAFGLWLEFDEVEVVLDPAAAVFEVRPLSDRAAACKDLLPGRVGWFGDRCLTALALR